VLKFLLLVLFLGVAIYLGIRLLQGRGDDGGTRPVPRPMAPDDDPEFLRDLDRRRRRLEDPDS
jgi:hypothetical protein